MLESSPRLVLRVVTPLLLLSAAGATPQHLPDPFASATPEWNAVDHGEGLTPLEAICEDLTGDHLVDTLYSTQPGLGAPAIQYGPGQYQSVFELQTQTRDVAALPGGGGFAALTPSGLFVMTDYEAGTFDVQRVVSGAPWSTALRLVLGDADGDGSLDAVALDADESTLLLRKDISGAQGATSSFTLPHAVLDFLVLEWGGAPAVAALTRGGLYIRSWDGAPLDEFVGGVFASGRLAAYRDSGSSEDRLACLYRAGGSDYLGVTDAGGAVDLVALGDIGAYHVVAGDVDGDGLGDLLVAQRVNHYVALFPGQGGADPFGPIVPVDLGLGALPASGQAADLVLADFTNDGDLDLYTYVAAAGAYVLLENGSRDSAVESPAIGEGTYFYSESLTQGQLSVQVTSTDDLAFTPTHIELVVWTQDDLEGTVDAVALEHASFPLDASGTATVQFSMSEPSLETEKIYHLDVRAVALQGHQVVEAGPSAVWSFATPADTVGEIQDLYQSSGIPIRIFLIDPPYGRFLTDQEVGERILVPSTVKGDKIKPTDLPPDPLKG